MSDEREFIQKIVATRNYLSHLDPDSKEAATRGGELFDVVQKLKIILTICLLNQLEFSNEDIIEIMKKEK
jgi:hypothetical protein